MHDDDDEDGSDGDNFSKFITPTYICNYIVFGFVVVVCFVAVCFVVGCFVVAALYSARKWEQNIFIDCRNCNLLNYIYLALSLHVSTR